ncbi:hypothetical protein [Nocardia lijiangensis]|uniref:hypothetical protein n=1 Tax=Nocardia lijiangensis TaxID=299618 RepID=UPI000A655226|nr:hypothetical protein [Nocardia lijiangensis]
MRGTVTTLSALAAAATALTLGAGAASAIAVNPIPNGTRVDLNQAEAGAIATLNLGPALGALPPNYTPLGKQALGQTLAEGAAQAARTPGGTLSVLILGELTAPSAVGVTVR